MDIIQEGEEDESCSPSAHASHASAAVVPQQPLDIIIQYWCVIEAAHAEVSAREGGGVAVVQKCSLQGLFSST